MTHNLAAVLPRVPRTAFFEITEACNLRCVHCWREADVRDRDEMGTDEALEVASELAAAGCTEVRLTGGEPLLREDWPGIATRFTGLGVAVTVITNGSLVDEAAAEAMRAAGVSRVAVSIDGEREVHDAIRVPAVRGFGSSFDRAVHGLDVLRRAGIATSVITQIHRRNVSGLKAVHDLAVAAGADTWQVQIAMPLGRMLDLRYEYLISPDDLPRLETQLARLIGLGAIRVMVTDNIGYYGPHEAVLRGAVEGRAPFFAGCQAGCGVVAIRSNGDVKGCPSHPDTFSVGNLRREPFAYIWNDAARFPYNTAFEEEHLEGGCKRCSFRRVCRAGCTTMAFAVTGTIYDNPFCSRRAGERAPGER
jgi:radical SAM protein with 4Fe4S-binding SPASM domain